MTSRSTRLAATFDRTATQLASIEASISSAVRAVARLGPDAESFRGSWDRGMESQLAGLSARLTSIAKDLRAGCAAPPPSTPSARTSRSAAPRTSSTAEIGANLGKGNAPVGLGGGVSQSDTFDSQAEAFVDGLYERLTPDADWSVFGGPGAVMADTVTDVVDHLSGHSEQRTKLEGGEGDPHQALLVTARIAGSRIVTSRVHFPPSTADTDRPLALAILGCLQTARPGPPGLTAQPARAGAGTRTTAIRVAERRTSWGPSAPGVSA